MLLSCFVAIETDLDITFILQILYICRFPRPLRDRINLWECTSLLQLIIWNYWRIFTERIHHQPRQPRSWSLVKSLKRYNNCNICLCRHRALVAERSTDHRTSHRLGLNSTRGLNFAWEILLVHLWIVCDFLRLLWFSLPSHN